MLDFALSAFVTLLLVVDPVGLAPAFLAATGGMPDKVKRTIALRAPLIAASILVVISLAGNWLLRQLGIGIPAFQIAGGLLLFGVSYQMIFGDRPHREAREADKATSEHASDVAVFPLAIPMMAGPGAITATILLAGRSGGDSTQLMLLLAVIVVVLALCFVVFSLAGRIGKMLGTTANVVASRLLGVLLAALAVQFVIDGVRAALAGS